MKFFKVYIRDNGNTFEGGQNSFVFIQGNRENSSFKKIEVEEAKIKDLTVSGDIVFAKKIPTLNVTQAHIENLTVSKNSRIHTLEITDNLTYQNGNLFSGIVDYNKIPNLKKIYMSISIFHVSGFHFVI